MDDKKSPLYIDPFQYPSEKDIMKKWSLWEKAEGKPCKTSAIKWLQCMGLVKEFYRMQGNDLKDGMEWHNFMLNKCYTPYTDYKGCVLDEQHAEINKLKAEYGEEKWKNSAEVVKGVLAEKFGPERAEQMWAYSNDYHDRFHALRKAVDEERGIIRSGMKVPDIATMPEPINVTRETEKPKPNREAPTPEPSSDKQQGFAGVKGWWSPPESRFKKPGDSSS